MKFHYPRITGWQDAEKNFEQLESATTPNWVAVTHENSWADLAGYQGAEYSKDADGFVHIRGVVDSGTVGSGTGIFTLPLGFRPALKEIFAVDSVSAHGRVDVDIDGTVDVIVGTNTYVSLSGITFAAA